MSPDASTPTSSYQRLRIRFRKEGDLRWIGHRDLLRTVERVCRRAALTLRMSEGFHPKPKMSFPSALAVGIEGRGEVMELELVDPVDPQQVQQQLNACAPAGLVFTQVEVRPDGQRKAQLRLLRYQFPVPDERCESVAAAIESMMAAPSLLVQRDDRPQAIDILADLASIDLSAGIVHFSLRATGQASARPRDVLQALGLADLEQQGLFLTRTDVEVAS